MHGRNRRNSIEAYLSQIFSNNVDRITTQLYRIAYSNNAIIDLTCIPITAKMKIIITKTNVRFPRAPIDFPMIDIKRFNVGQDLANLNTRN